MTAYAKLIETSSPLIWYMLQSICRVQDRISDVKLTKVIKAWGHMMKIKNVRHQGLALPMGLAMFQSGCSKQFFELAHAQGICCTLEAVNDYLKSTTCGLAQVLEDKSKICLYGYDNCNFGSNVKFEGPNTVAKMVNITLRFAVATQDWDRALLGKPCQTTAKDITARKILRSLAYGTEEKQLFFGQTRHAYERQAELANERKSKLPNNPNRPNKSPDIAILACFGEVKGTRIIKIHYTGPSEVISLDYSPANEASHEGTSVILSG